MGDPISDSAVEQITKADRSRLSRPMQKCKVPARLRRLSSTVLRNIYINNDQLVSTYSFCYSYCVIGEKLDSKNHIFAS